MSFLSHLLVYSNRSTDFPCNVFHCASVIQLISKVSFPVLNFLQFLSETPNIVERTSLAYSVTSHPAGFSSSNVPISFLNLTSINGQAVPAIALHLSVVPGSVVMVLPIIVFTLL